MNKSGIPRDQFNLLSKIINSRPCFDTKDNTFKLSNRKIADTLGVTRHSVNKLMKTLKEQDLVRRVTATLGGALMLNPVFITTKPRDTYWFNKALYYLGYYEDAIEWTKVCWDIGYLIEPETGEILFKKSPINTLNKDLVLARQNRECRIAYNVISSSGYNRDFRLDKDK